MRKDFFISYARQDAQIARQVKEYLTSHGMSVCLDQDELHRGDWPEQIVNAIRDSDGMIVIISESSMASTWVKKEIDLALDTARERNKVVVPLVLNGTVMNDIFRFWFCYLQCLYIDPSDPQWPERALDSVVRVYAGSNAKTRKYEEFSELKKLGLRLEASDKLTEIIELILARTEPRESFRSQYEMMLELDRCLKELNELYDCDYSRKAREVTGRKLDMLGRLQKLIKPDPGEEEDLFDICCVIRMIYWDREIRWDCADMITHGDAGQGIVQTLPEREHARRQSAYRALYLAASKEPAPGQPQAVTDFIRGTGDYLYEKVPEPRGPAPEKPAEPSRGDEKLQAIAGYIREGNRVFELIGEDEKAAAFIQCLITSYERLKAYCEEIGAREITAECITRITALKERYLRMADTGEPSEPDKPKNDCTVAEKSIRALLGFTRPGLGTYDVFLSHKNYDIDIAQDVYKFLKSNLREVFFDKISLPELSRAEYKDAILQALDRSKHFAVIITDIRLLEHRDHVDENDWVQKEMDLFHSELFEGRKKGGNFVILVTDKVFDEITKHNKQNIDIKWRSYNLIRVRDYRDRMMSYLK